MEKLKIYIDRLKNGHSETIEAVLPSNEYLGINEDELRFADTISIKAEAYLADDHLVTHLNIETQATLPCSICNAHVQFPITIDDAYNATAIEEIQGAIYDLSEEIRENILLNTPLFIECNNGQCPERSYLESFMAKKPQANSEKASAPAASHYPFADL